MVRWCCVKHGKREELRSKHEKRLMCCCIDTMHPQQHNADNYDNAETCSIKTTHHTNNPNFMCTGITPSYPIPSHSLALQALVEVHTFIAAQPMVDPLGLQAPVIEQCTMVQCPASCEVDAACAKERGCAVHWD